MKSGCRRTVWWTGGIFLAFMVLECMGIQVTVVFIETVICLAFGWIGFLERVVPQVQVRWDIVTSSALCTMVLVVSAHLFLRWLYREIGGSDGSSAARRWHKRWTLSGAVAVLLMFSAGIGMIGVIHQTAWLARSPVPLIRARFGEHLNRPRCAMRLKQIGYAIQQYASDNGGHYPEDWRTLLLNENESVNAGDFICPSSDDEWPPGATTREIANNLMQPHHCSYIYYGKGLSTPVASDRVIAAEPLENHDGEGMNVLFGDGQVKWVEKDEANKLLASVAPTTQPTTRAP